MDRRALLGRLGAAGTLGAAAFAGCLGTGGDSTAPGDSPGTDGTDTPDDPVTNTGETPGGETPDDSTTTPDGDAAVVGDPSSVAFPDTNRPHSLTFENATDDPVTLAVAVAAEGRGEVWAETVELASGGSFGLRLAEPAHYTIRVDRADGGNAGDPDATVDVPLSHFDCNDSGTTVKVTTDGVDATTFTTELACHGPELVDASFDAGEGACGDPDADAADVRYDGEAVRVTGAVSMPDPCRDVSLSEATYDEGESALFLTVRVAAADPAATCAACVGVRDYEVTADFDVDLPARVVVRHAGADRATKVVARAVRGGADEAQKV